MQAKTILEYSKLHQGSYQTDATIVWCIDARFDLAYEKLIEKFNLKNCDLIKIPGAAKALVQPDLPAFDVILSYIQASIKLHQPKEILLCVHQNCGAYLMDHSFANDQSEKQKLTKDLGMAWDNLANQLKKDGLDLPPVKKLWVGFEKVEEIG